MIPLIWTDSLAVGVKELDEDHKELIGMISDLQLTIHSAYEQGKFDNEEIALALDRLKTHTKIHFEREELYFFNTCYPCQESHRLEHVKLIRKITESIERFHACPCQKAAVDIMQFICDWLVGHFFVTDRKYSVHFETQKDAKPAPVLDPVMQSLCSSVSSSLASTPQLRTTQRSRPSQRVIA